MNERPKPYQPKEKSYKRPDLDQDGYIDAFRVFLNRAGKFPLFTPEQEVLAFKAYGQEKAAEQQATDVLLAKLSPTQKLFVELRLELSNNGEKTNSDEDIAKKLTIHPQNEEYKETAIRLANNYKKEHGEDPTEEKIEELLWNHTIQDIETSSIAALMDKRDDKRQRDSIDTIFKSAKENARKGTNALKILKDAPQFPEKFDTAIDKSESVADLIASCNLRLVTNIAKRWDANKLTIEDRIQEGYTGLKVAIERFEPERGFKFSTFATTWIKQSIRRATANTDRMIRIPVYVEENISTGTKKLGQFKDQYHRNPTIDELANDLISKPISKEKAKDVATMILSGSLMVDSINKPISTDGEIEAGQLIPADTNTEDEAMASIQSEELVAALTRLPEREKDIFIKRNIDNMSFEAIGDIHKRTRETISKLHANAIKKLRNDPTLKEFES